MKSIQPSGCTALVLLACISIASGQSSSRAEDDSSWIIVRHGEKADRPANNPRLTPAGHARAERLKSLAVPLRVAAVYSTNTRRTLDTAQPTADTIGTEVRKYALDPSDPDPAWFAAIRARHSSQTVLIVGHSNTIGPIIRGLGVAGEFPIQEREFDRLFIVTTGNGESTVSRLRYGKSTSVRQRSVRSAGSNPDSELKEISDRLGHKAAVPPPGLEFKFVPVRRVGKLLYLSGNLPFNGKEGLREKHKGKVGGENGASIEEAREAAQFTTLNLLNDAQKHLGSLNRVVSVVEVFGMVNSREKFTDQPKVIDACSELLLDVFGKEVGSHTRCAVGVAELPFDASVEIKMILEVADEN